METESIQGTKILELRTFVTSVLLARIEPDHLQMEMVGLTFLVERVKMENHALDIASVCGLEELIIITGSWIAFKSDLVGNS